MKKILSVIALALLSIGGAIGMTSMATFKVGNVSQRLKRNTVSVTVGYNF